MTVDVPGYGPLTSIWLTGATSDAILPAEAVGLSLEPSYAQVFIQAGMTIMAATSQQVRIEHPVNPGINELKHVLFTGPAQAEGADANGPGHHLPGRLGPLALRHRHQRPHGPAFRTGPTGLNWPFVHESRIGTTFTGETGRGSRPYARSAVLIPTIAGRAWITGFNQLVLDPEDPFPAGFL